jgi:hypothetical protein
MVWLGGRRGSRTPPIVLHDPPPGYRPPHRPGIPLKDRQRQAREYLAVMRVATVVLVVAAAAFMVIIFVIIATHS